ncbi:MAG: tRNA uridine-5-carboxymethylaminomethyl(34) synthesis GTPase MnmE [Candidatus Omnitrophica bacterium]|nr:tRNA uridine-5-carboxymethylaminomethyl(34) synthesis GTPase MnmE [Candidatus Omnitrophota bacterium]
MINHNPGDTIAAISTPIGEGGIGIVRLSGQKALSICDKVFIPAAGKKPSGFKTYTTHYGTIVKDGKVIDEVILTVMRAPKSYTREDVAEINCHGGIVALRDTLNLVLDQGARLAEPGEFTKRAFLNGRIDLTQAEAVLDIIRARTDSALKMGIEQLRGGLSGRINKHRESLLGILVELEASIDFPEEEISISGLKSISNRIVEIEKGLEELIRGSKLARMLREGIHVVICGKPNVGKSSLLNALLQEERSIVTHIAGTTRDAIEEIIDIKGIPVRIVDTAGILEPRDLVEKKAVKRSQEHITAADLVLIIFDGSRRLAREDLFLISRLKKKKAIVLINKIDLKQKIEREKLEKSFQNIIGISAKKTKNIDKLEEMIADLVYGGSIVSSESLLVANLRYIRALQKAKIAIAQAQSSLDNNLSAEFIAQGIKEGVEALDEMLGKRFSEDLLDKIFSEFCIGK